MGNRKERARLLKSAKAGEFQVVVVRDYSRFSRDVAEFSIVIFQLQESGIAIQTIQKLP